jgi:trehalose utilization protein
MAEALRVTVWNEFIHENPARLETLKTKYRNLCFSEEHIIEATQGVVDVYPDGIHSVIAKHLRQQRFTVNTATLDEPEHGLTEAVMAETDVLIWWGHLGHDEVSDEIVERIHERVITHGMGLIVLHSGHYSKIFKKLMGTSCSLKARESGERERVWVVEPGHPIARGLDEHFDVPESEMYGELFDIPAPDTLVFVSWFEGGEVFRSGCCYNRGRGKIFYFSPGHETHPIYYQSEIQQVLTNAVEWARPF